MHQQGLNPGGPARRWRIRELMEERLPRAHYGTLREKLCKEVLGISENTLLVWERQTVDSHLDIPHIRLASIAEFLGCQGVEELFTPEGLAAYVGTLRSAAHLRVFPVIAKAA